MAAGAFFVLMTFIKNLIFGANLAIITELSLSLQIKLSVFRFSFMMEKEIYLAGGCFWGTEHYFKQIEGVVETSVGFANGHTANPTYKEVYTDTTGYAETVHVKYNPDVVSLEFLLQMFFKAIDPTSLNKQGHDEGTRYRTGIYYTDSEDLPVIEKVFAEEQKNYQQPLAVEKLPLENYYTAEEYHQDYLDKNPDGYCHLPLSLFEFARQAKEKRVK
jgi:peptide methionine sulfoxide reductase msrA/msrB